MKRKKEAAERGQGKPRGNVPTYFIHVKEDGSEIVFQERPDHLPTLTVERAFDWEITSTRKVLCDALFPPMLTHVTPPGRGWKAMPPYGGPVTKWARRVRE